MLWEHKLLLEGTVSNNNGDDRENVTCTFKVNLRFLKFTFHNSQFQAITSSRFFIPQQLRA